MLREVVDPLLTRIINSFNIYSSVTQPCEADFTFLMYLKSVPRVAFKGGATQTAARAAMSSEDTLVSIRLMLASMVITSPF